MRPVLAGRGRKRLEKLADELGGLEVARRRRQRAAQRRGARRRGRRPRHDRRPVRTLGRAGADGGAHQARPLPRLDRREHVRAARVRDRRAARRERGRRAADGDGLRLGARATSPARWRCARPARTRGACGSATSSTPRSAAPGSAARSAAARAPRPPARCWTRGFAFRDGRLVDERPARRVASFDTHDGRREPGDLGRLVRAFHAAAPGRRARRGRRLPRLVRRRLAADAGDDDRRRDRAPRAGRAHGPARRRGPLRQGQQRRPRRPRHARACARW